MGFRMRTLATPTAAAQASSFSEPLAWASDALAGMRQPTRINRSRIDMVAFFKVRCFADTVLLRSHKEVLSVAPRSGGLPTALCMETRPETPLGRTGVRRLGDPQGRHSLRTLLDNFRRRRRWFSPWSGSLAGESTTRDSELSSVNFFCVRMRWSICSTASAAARMVLSNVKAGRELPGSCRFAVLRQHVGQIGVGFGLGLGAFEQVQ